MSKYKITHSFALSNKQYIEKLEKLSSEGWHFKKYLFIFTLLEKGEAKNYKYELIYDKRFDKERIDFYRAGGWEVVRNSFFWQILRGEQGASELYTDSESKVEMWKFRLKFTAVLSLVCVLISLFSFIFNRSINNEFLDFVQKMFFGWTLVAVVLNIFFYIMYRLELGKE